MIFNLHNIKRQKAREPNKVANMETKSKKTSFKIVSAGEEIPMTHAVASKIWDDVIEAVGLTYKNFLPGDPENWYGTMGPYLDMFCSFSLRMNELRLGHNNFPISKVDGTHKSFPFTKYGLSGAHHILLEGASFPPERRSSIVQSLGPMTVWLCMLRSEGMYRKKYQAAVKRAMAHIPGIDDIIELTKNIKTASEISTLTTLLAEILLITTARQATRIFFPLTLFAQYATNEIINRFNTTGRGGWFLYKECTNPENEPLMMNGTMEAEQAQKIVFHAMFGTYKEDLGILEQITTVGKWFTREELGSCFINPKGKHTPVTFRLPTVTHYSKMSCANQTGLLTGVYNQVATSPCFSGQRVHIYDQDFFEHIEKRKVIGSIGKTLPQIIAHLTSTLEELHDHLKQKNGKLEMGTTSWKVLSSLTLDADGPDTTAVIVGKGKKFLGRRMK